MTCSSCPGAEVRKPGSGADPLRRPAYRCLSIIVTCCWVASCSMPVTRMCKTPRLAPRTTTIFRRPQGPTSPRPFALILQPQTLPLSCCFILSDSTQAGRPEGPRRRPPHRSHGPPRALCGAAGRGGESTCQTQRRAAPQTCYYNCMSDSLLWRAPLVLLAVEGGRSAVLPYRTLII